MSLASELTAAGLNVKTVTGWGTRGGSWSAGQPVGYMVHHTAPPVPFPVDRLYGDLLKANINIKPDGTVWLIAAKACNFSSGPGSSVVLAEVRRGQPPSRNARERGLTDDIDGNPWFFNNEVDHPGDGSPIPQVQLDAVVQATRVVLDHYGLGSGNVVSHAEWTARKRDPYWNGSLRAIEEIRTLLEEDPVMKPPDWAVPATQWHIDNGIYTEARVTDVDESVDFHRQTVFRHRFYTKIIAQIATSGTAHNHDGRYLKSVTGNK